MPYYLQISLYLLAVAFGAAAGIYNRKLLDKAAKTFVALLIVTFFTEACSVINAFTTGNNMPMYHAFAVVQLVFIIAYFLRVNKTFSAGRIIAAGTIAAGAALLNTIYFQPLTDINSNFLMAESIVIVVMSVITLYRITDDQHILRPYHNIHFRIWTFLLILWSATFFWWALYKYIEQNMETFKLANNIRVILNILVYAGTGIALMKLPKKDAG